jgi:hypothetical protein
MGPTTETWISHVRVGTSSVDLFGESIALTRHPGLVTHHRPAVEPEGGARLPSVVEAFSYPETPGESPQPLSSSLRDAVLGTQ